MDGRTDGWMDEWTDGRTDEWIDGRKDGWMNERTDGRTDGWMDEWMREWTDRSWDLTDSLKGQYQIDFFNIIKSHLPFLVLEMPPRTSRRGKGVVGGG